MIMLDGCFDAMW